MAFKTAPMSTAQNEAENGPAMFGGDDHNHSEDLEVDGGESAGDLPLRASERIEMINGDGDGNIVATSATSRGLHIPEQEHHEADSNLESSTTPERPSSADGSLSIPDTLSIQVGSHPASRQLVTDLNLARSPNYPLQADKRFVHPMFKAQPLLYAPSTDAFKLVSLLLLLAHLDLLLRPPLIHVPAKRLYQAKYTAIQEIRNNLRRHGR